MSIIFRDDVLYIGIKRMDPVNAYALFSRATSCTGVLLPQLVWFAFRPMLWCLAATTVTSVRLWISTPVG